MNVWFTGLKQSAWLGHYSFIKFDFIYLIFFKAPFKALSILMMYMYSTVVFDSVTHNRSTSNNKDFFKKIFTIYDFKLM